MAPWPDCSVSTCWNNPLWPSRNYNIHPFLHVVAGVQPNPHERVTSLTGANLGPLVLGTKSGFPVPPCVVSFQSIVPRQTVGAPCPFFFLFGFDSLDAPRLSTGYVPPILLLLLLQLLLFGSHGMGHERNPVRREATWRLQRWRFLRFRRPIGPSQSGCRVLPPAAALLSDPLSLGLSFLL